MQSYKRKITYFYQYHNGTVGSTAGFLKLEIRGDKVKIIINIQEPPGLPYREASLYFYHEAGDHLAAVKVDTIESRNGILTYLNRTDWQQLFDTGRDLYTFDGVVVAYNDNHYYIGDFQDKDRRDYGLVIKEKRVLPKKAPQSIWQETQSMEPVGDGLKVIAQPDMEELENLAKEHMTGEGELPEKSESDRQQNLDDTKRAPMEGEPAKIEQSLVQPEEEKKKQDHTHTESEPLYSKCENCPYQKKHMEKKEQVDAFEKMLEEYPKLPMYGATELFDCVRIHPRDIGKLDMRNWKLGVNSFLTHGFYTYQYLLLGKMRFGDGTTHPIIGVPGVYSNREKYLANMFGFEQFIPVKKTGVKTGEFGYWIVEISPYL